MKVRICMNVVLQKNMMIGLLFAMFSVDLHGQRYHDELRYLQPYQQSASIDTTGNLPEFSLGLLIGVCGVLAVQEYYNWLGRQDQGQKFESKKVKHPVYLHYAQRLVYLQKSWYGYDTTALDFDDIALVTEGFTKHQLERLVKSVSKLATEYRLSFLEEECRSSELVVRYPITMSIVRLALDEIYGGSIEYYDLDYENQMYTALHEAGHALAIIEHENYCLDFVSTICREKSAGRNIYSVLIAQDHKMLQDCQYEIIVALCGGVAEQMFGFDKAWYKKQNWVYKDYAPVGHISKGLRDILSRSSVSNDILTARDVAGLMVINKLIEPTHFDQHGKVDMEVEIELILEECYQQAVALLATRKADLQKIASLLLTKDIICEQEIKALFV